MELSVIDQLRLQEGRLFQSEAIVALFLDVKTVAQDALQREADVSKFLSLDDESIQILVNNLKSLGPKGYKDYHTRSLYECVKVVAKLLWPSEALLVAKPALGSLMNGFMRRLAASEPVVKNVFLSMDPIKQDFIYRESFRRTIVNDCLIVFEEDMRPELPFVKEEDEEIGPDDSISYVGERPSGARSVLGVDLESRTVLDSRMDSRTVMPTVIQVERSDSKTVVTKISKAQSSVSAAQSTTRTNVSMPTNVKKIHIEDDKTI
jgi:hypothetical protein